MPVSRLLIFLAVTMVSLAACLPTLDQTPTDVVEEIDAALGPGAPREEIESYLDQRGLEYSFDRFTNRYQATIRHPNSIFHAISIQIHLDANGQFERVEANDSYTFL